MLVEIRTPDRPSTKFYQYFNHGYSSTSQSKRAALRASSVVHDERHRDLRRPFRNFFVACLSG